MYDMDGHLIKEISLDQSSNNNQDTYWEHTFENGYKVRSLFVLRGQDYIETRYEYNNKGKYVATSEWWLNGVQCSIVKDLSKVSRHYLVVDSSLNFDIDAQYIFNDLGNLTIKTTWYQLENKTEVGNCETIIEYLGNLPYSSDQINQVRYSPLGMPLYCQLSDGTVYSYIVSQKGFALSSAILGSSEEGFSTTEYNYDDEYRLSSIDDNSGKVIYYSNYVYDKNGNIISCDVKVENKDYGDSYCYKNIYDIEYYD